MADPYYSTSTAVGAYLGTTFDGSTTPTYETVASFIKQASAEIDTRTGRSWSQVQVTQELHGTIHTDPPNIFFTKGSPVVSLGTFEVNTGSDENQDWEVQTENDDYIVDQDIGRVVFYGFTLYRGYRTARISYIHGETTTPKDIERAATIRAAAIALGVQRQLAGASGLMEFEVGQARYKLAGTRDLTAGYDQEFERIMNARGRRMESVVL